MRVAEFHSQSMSLAKDSSHQRKNYIATLHNHTLVTLKATLKAKPAEGLAHIFGCI